MPLKGTAKDVVLITGSSGFIGSALVRRLAPRFQIVGFDRAKHHEPPYQAECVCTDITSDQDLEASFRRLRYAYGDRIAAVIHLAAFYDFSGEPSPKYDEVNVEGTRRLLEHLQDFEVEEFVYSSTMLVHAPCQPGERIHEDWPLKPKWPYPESKVKAERVIHEARGSIPAVILRIAGVYDDVCHSIPLAHQIQRIYERQFVSHMFPGDLTHGQAYVHLADTVDAIERAIDSRNTLPEEVPILIGEEETLSYGELQREIGRLVHGEPWETREIPKEIAKVGAWLEEAMPGEEPFIRPFMIDIADDHYALDTARARRLLGWQPERSLRDTLPLMIDQLKADPLGWYRENKLEAPGWLEREASRPREVEAR